MTAPRRVDIAVCTFRRPGLSDTLRSLSALDWPEGTTGRIVVIDNDDRPSAEALVTAFAVTSPLPVLYRHHPGRNIAEARNAALASSDAPLLAFLDDDETADPGWIVALVGRIEATGADAVLGPVRAVYGPGAPDWMRRGQVHATRPVWVGGAIRTGYTCNVLLDRRSPHLQDLRFDPALGRSGGEDSRFFSELHARGGRIAFAPEAWLSEGVAPDRARLGWLLHRRWRMGLTHARDALGPAPGAAERAKAAALAASKAAVCGAAALASLPWPLPRGRWMMRGALHAGAAWGALGGRPPAIYGSTSAPEVRNA